MTTTDKLAEVLATGLECAHELLAEKQQALAGHPEKVAPYQEMVDYLRRELAAHEQAQAGEPVGYINEMGEPVLLPENRKWMSPDKDYHLALRMAKKCHGNSLLYRATPQPAQAERVAWPSASEIADEIDALLPMSLGDATMAAIEGWWLQLVARKLSKLPITHQAQAERVGLTLDAFDEHDLCDSFAGLPVEWFNPGPAFGGIGGAKESSNG